MQDQIELYLETNGIRGEMIKRAKEQRQRLSEYLDKKSIICTILSNWLILVSPIALNPPFPHNYTLSTDHLYDQELRLAMQKLSASALEPLSVPSMSLLVQTTGITCSQSVPLAKLKQLPISLLATLVIANLSNTPHSSLPDTTNQFTSLKREFNLEETEKRSRRDKWLCECEEINEPHRLALQELLLRSFFQCARSSLLSIAPEVLCDCAISLLSICDPDQSIVSPIISL